jgi:hypothetical protein
MDNKNRWNSRVGYTFLFIRYYYNISCYNILCGITMKFYFDSEKIDELNEKLKGFFFEHQEQRNTVHLSDTCHCEIKAYNRLTGMEWTVDNSAINFMLFGDAGQILLQRLYPESEIEYVVDGAVVPCHIDIFEDEKHVIEIKWSAQRIFRASDVSEGWRLQLMRYMALTNTSIGWLVIVNIYTRQLTAFKLTMTDDELAEQLKQIVESKERILKADKEKNTVGLIIIDTECGSCGYRPTRVKKKAKIKSCQHYTTRSKAVGRRICKVHQESL